MPANSEGNIHFGSFGFPRDIDAHERTCWRPADGGKEPIISKVPVQYGDGNDDRVVLNLCHAQDTDAQHHVGGGSPSNAADSAAVQTVSSIRIRFTCDSKDAGERSGPLISHFEASARLKPKEIHAAERISDAKFGDAAPVVPVKLIAHGHGDVEVIGAVHPR